MTPRYSTRVLTYAVETQNAVLKRYRILRKDARAVLNVRRNQELNRSHRSLKAPAEGGFYFAYYPRRCSFRAVATRARWDASSRNLFKCQARPAEGGFYFAYFPRRRSFRAAAISSSISSSVIYPFSAAIARISLNATVAFARRTARRIVSNESSETLNIRNVGLPPSMTTASPSRRTSSQTFDVSFLRSPID